MSKNNFAELASQLGINAEEATTLTAIAFHCDSNDPLLLSALDSLSGHALHVGYKLLGIDVFVPAKIDIQKSNELISCLQDWAKTRKEEIKEKDKKRESLDCKIKLQNRIEDLERALKDVLPYAKEYEQHYSENVASCFEDEDGSYHCDCDYEYSISKDIENAEKVLNKKENVYD